MCTALLYTTGIPCQKGETPSKQSLKSMRKVANMFDSALRAGTVCTKKKAAL